jgi:hypothetical protein
VFVDGTTTPIPEGVRTADTNQPIEQGRNYFIDEAGNWYTEDWEAPGSPDMGRHTVLDEEGTIAGVPFGQYFVDNNGIIVDVGPHGDKTLIGTKPPPR